MILRRFLAAIVLMVLTAIGSIFLYLWIIISGIISRELWSSITFAPLAIIALWKAMFVLLRTMDVKLTMEYFQNKIEELL